MNEIPTQNSFKIQDSMIHLVSGEIRCDHRKRNNEYLIYTVCIRLIDFWDMQDCMVRYMVHFTLTKTLTEFSIVFIQKTVITQVVNFKQLQFFSLHLTVRIQDIYIVDVILCMQNIFLKQRPMSLHSYMTYS